MSPTALISYPVATVRDNGSFVPRHIKEVDLFSIVVIKAYFRWLLFVAYSDRWPLNSDHLSW